MVKPGRPSVNSLSSWFILSENCSLTNKKCPLEFNCLAPWGRYWAFYSPQPTLESTLSFLSLHCILYLYIVVQRAIDILLTKSSFSTGSCNGGEELTIYTCIDYYSIAVLIVWSFMWLVGQSTNMFLTCPLTRHFSGSWVTKQRPALTIYGVCWRALIEMPSQITPTFSLEAVWIV